MKNQIGIWLDFREAQIIGFIAGQPSVKRIESKVERHNSKGGSRSKTPYGPMLKVSESKVLERRKHQEKEYFESLIEALREADELYVFGPAEAKNGLVKAIAAQHVFQTTIKKIESADSMTENQKIAQVSRFFDWD